MNDRIQNWRETTWQIRPVLDVPELDPEVVQLSILDTDPIEDYRKSLQQNSNRFRKEVRDEKDSGQRELLKRIQMTAMWDQLFKVTTGHQVYLLSPTRSKKNESVARALVISSDDPAGRRWLTTKIAYRNGVPICWCLPVQAAQGEAVEVRLQKENALDIRTIYEQIINVP